MYFNARSEFLSRAVWVVEESERRKKLIKNQGNFCGVNPFLCHRFNKIARSQKATTTFPPHAIPIFMTMTISLRLIFNQLILAKVLDFILY